MPRVLTKHLARRHFIKVITRIDMEQEKAFNVSGHEDMQVEPRQGPKGKAG